MLLFMRKSDRDEKEVIKNNTELSKNANEMAQEYEEKQVGSFLIT